MVRNTSYKITAPWINVQAAAASIASHDKKLLWPAVLHNIVIHALHAVLMKFGVFSKRHYITKQCSVIDGRASILNLYSAPVWLASNRAIRL